MSDSLFYEDWLAKAKEDELAAERLMGGDGLFSPVCFHSQQMAEKLLKALLLYKGQTFEKIHDLSALGKLLQPLFPDVLDLKSDLLVLSKFYIKTRYPADYPEFTKKQAEQAYECALRVKDFVNGKIGKKN